MDSRRVLFVGSLCFALSLTALLAAAPVPSDGMSVGDFAVMVASKIQDDNVALTPEAASNLLRKHGVKFGADLNSPLTEKEAAGMFGQLGIVLQSDHPESVLSRDRAASLVGIFGSSLATVGERTTGSFSARTTGTSAAVPSVETTPLDCQSLPRPPAPCSGPQSVCNPCMDCCKNELGLTGKVCGRLCQKKNLVISPGEPTP
jgi:hypothetical protein